MSKINEWRKEIAKKHTGDSDNFIYVVPENSFAARGYTKTGRKWLGTEVSPFGGRYDVFDSETAAGRKAKMDNEAQELVDASHFRHVDYDDDARED